MNPAAPTTTSIPEGWTTSVTVCTVCGPTRTTVTLTVPRSTSSSSSQVGSASGSANIVPVSASGSLDTAGPVTGSPSSTKIASTGSQNSASSAIGSSRAPQPESTGSSSGLSASNSAPPFSIGLSSAPSLPAQGSQPAPSPMVVGQGAQNTASPASAVAATHLGTFVTLTSQSTASSTSVSTASVVCADKSYCTPSPVAGKEVSPMSTSTGSMQVVTMTIVPVPNSSAQPAGFSSGSYGSSNSTGSASSFPGPSASATVPTFPAAPVFTGAGAKKGVSGFGILAVTVAFMFLL